MAYFSRKQDGMERACKVAADIFCAVLLAIFSVVFFGPVVGLVGFVILEAGLLGTDYLMPDEDAGSASGAAVR